MAEEKSIQPSDEEREEHSQGGGKSGPLARELGDTKREEDGAHKNGATGTGGPGGTGGSVL